MLRAMAARAQRDQPSEPVVVRILADVMHVELFGRALRNA